MLKLCGWAYGDLSKFSMSLRPTHWCALKDFSTLAVGHDGLTKRDMAILTTLFNDQTECVVNQGNAYYLTKAIDDLRFFLSSLGKKYINRNTKTLGVGTALAVIGIVPVFVLSGLSGDRYGMFSRNGMFFLLLAYYIVVKLLAVYLLKTYTPEGRALQDQIDGFKLFLETTETERLNIIGTPPTKTPELFEHYLPYAMALGVEKQWSQQFAPIFERLEQSGTPYIPLWFIGAGDWHHFNAGSFATSLNSSLTQTISSSSTPPGSSSGSGGGGCVDGGGGGGGGGGGW